MLTNFPDMGERPFGEPRPRRHSAQTPNSDLTSAAAGFDSLAAWAAKVSDVLKAAAHEGRFLVLRLLADGEKSVSELEEIMTLPQSVVSQHLARLRHDGLVKARREGRIVYYSLANAESAAMISVFCRYGVLQGPTP